MKSIYASACFAAFALLSPLSSHAADQAPMAAPAVVSAAPALPSDMSGHIRETFIRVILPLSEKEQFIKTYTQHLNGYVTSEFDWPATHLYIVVMKSPFGNVSAEFTDRPEALDQFRKDTKVMYVVDDVPAVLAAAERDGMPIIQKLARTPVAMQGRFELLPGYVVEIVSFLHGK